MENKRKLSENDEYNDEGHVEKKSKNSDDTGTFSSRVSRLGILSYSSNLGESENLYNYIVGFRSILSRKSTEILSYIICDYIAQMANGHDEAREPHAALDTKLRVKLINKT